MTTKDILILEKWNELTFHTHKEVYSWNEIQTSLLIIEFYDTSTQHVGKKLKQGITFMMAGFVMK